MAPDTPLVPDAPLPGYAELHCLSAFSFLRGASQPDELVHRAQTLKYAALAITDECSLAGVVRAHAAARALAFPLVIGSEFTLDDGLKLVLHAVDRESYGDLAQLITRARRRAAKGHYVATRDDVADLGRRCLALWVPGAVPDLGEAGFLREVFGDRARMAVELFARGGDRARLALLGEASRDCGLAMLAAGDVHMHVRARRVLQDTMTAIRLRTPLAQCGHALFPNGERHLRSRARLASLHPEPLLAATLEYAAQCRFSLDELKYEYPHEIVPAGETPASHLRKLTMEGLARRYPRLAGDRGHPVPVKVAEQVEKELALIAELGYEPYFLTVHDVVAFARSKGILCQGRGSAANSVVCYALGITEIDPSLISALFERFVSRERNEPPDIDVDFEHQRREEVIQYVYGKYGRERAALAATLISYRTKSAVRDVGMALGFDLAQVDRLARVFAWWDGRGIDEARIREAGFDPASPMIERLVHLVGELHGFPRHLSQHVGGFVIGRGPIERMVPVENAAMKDRTVIEWDKDDLDEIGLLKVDCLALGMLSAIRRALDMVSASLGRTVTMQSIPREDPEVYAMIQRADTIGVFQIESRAQQSMLPRLKPACFYDLVIEVAIVRPGPIQGGMVHPYLRRRQGKEPVSYPNDAVKGVLHRTLGVPIFQEQVMNLAVVAANFTPGESDRLRRSMAAWRRKGGLEVFEQRLVDGMTKNKIPEAFARQIFQQILGFGEYGFPESHSASFSLLVYVSSWLKRYHPAAFAAGLLNAQPMGFYAPAQLVQDARRHGVEVRAPDVMASDWDCTLESAQVPAGDRAHVKGDAPATWGRSGPALRLGLRMIGGLREDVAQRIAALRGERPFASIADLAHRAALGKRELDALADADALAALAGHRHDAVWNVAGVEKLPAILAGATFDEAPLALPAPTEGQDIVADYRRIGLTLRRHPLALLRRQLTAKRLVTSRDVQETDAGRLARTAGIVIGRQRPDTASGVIFVTLEDEHGHVNVIVRRDIFDRQRRTLLGARLMAVYGKVEREASVVHVLAAHLVDLTPLLGALETRSRDFH